MVDPILSPREAPSLEREANSSLAAPNPLGKKIFVSTIERGGKRLGEAAEKPIAKRRAEVRAPKESRPPQEILFELGECSLGSILIAKSERGLCAILMGDDQKLLSHDLQKLFPKALLTLGNSDSKELLKRVVNYMETPGGEWDLPLDIQGTAFQKRVWEALQTIPSGKTLSYSELAEQLGRPSAVRAVGGASAANRLAVAIPCHRLVRKSGDLSGYRWGVKRKRELLKREKSLNAKKEASPS